MQITLCTLHVYFVTTCHCQEPVASGHFQATLGSDTLGNCSSSWSVATGCQAAGGKRHCQDSEDLSDSSSCHLQEAGSPLLHCQVIPLDDSANGSCRQCQHQLDEVNPDPSCQTHNNCFCQLFCLFQGLMRVGIFISLCGEDPMRSFCGKIFTICWPLCCPCLF